MYLFVHHCDLRIIDNTTINKLIENKFDFVPIFIGTPDQLDDNPYKSSNSIRYKKYGYILKIFFGETTQVLGEIIKNNTNIIGIANNIDYSPYAVDRDKKVADLCEKIGIQYLVFEDKLLNPVDSILTGKGTQYTKFTPYFNNASEQFVDKPVDNSDNFKGKLVELKQTKYDYSLEEISAKANNLSPDVQIKGGRSNALKILQGLNTFKKYNQDRNIPSKQTTRLSAHLKFGTISIREAYYAVYDNLGVDSELIKQFYWRDFYNMILYYYGTFQTPVSITKEEFKQIKWQDNKVSLQRWKDGMTGCPIVDAGMREMNSTGFMHNRLRMIVASFLIFFLKIDWREGMRYFSQKLVDIDWANNVGNWQWTAGVEKWSNDYYKVFSMESQIKRFDPECLYIKKWVPELSSVPPIDIINWEYSYVDYPKIQYPTPIISNNKESRKDGIQMYKDVIQNM
jgi:deoxyribodipyrimidine photo-lyase